MSELKFWNWQKDDWPDFRFDARRLAALEEKFLRAAGVFFGSFKHLANESRAPLEVELLSEEAV